MWWRCSIVTILLCAPYSLLHAQIIINEVAWAGSSASANDEWIELRNTGSNSVSLSGWVLEAADGTPAIALDGSIAAGGFFLLERTDDSSVPSVTADLIYTGALSNSGEVLRLFNDTGSQVDSVDGSSSWAVGGDAQTRATLQRSGAGFITAEGTPKVANQTSGQVTEDPPDALDDEDSSDDTGTILKTDSSENEEGSSRDREKRYLSEVNLHANRKTVFAGSPVLFYARSFDQREQRYFRIVYTWNMGDGTTYRGEEISHTYHHPGTYVIALRAVKGSVEIVKRRTVIVHEVGATVSDYQLGSGGFIEITNDGSKEINLSQWSIRSGADVFLVPYHTYVLPGASVRIHEEALGFIPLAAPSLHYPDGEEMREEVSVGHVSQGSRDVRGAKTSAPLISVAHAAEVSDGSVSTEIASQEGRFVSESAETEDSLMWWVVALVGLILVAVIAVFIINRQEESDIVDFSE